MPNRVKTSEKCIYRNLDNNKYDIKLNYKVYNPVTGHNEYKAKWYYGYAKLSEAKKKLAELRAVDDITEEKDITFEGMLEVWKQQAEFKSYSPVTVQNTMQHVRMLKPYVGDIKLKDITEDSYIEICNKLKHAGYSDESLRSLISTIRKFINLAYRKHYIKSNILAFVDNPRLKQKEDYTVIEKEVFDELAEYLHTHKFIRMGFDSYRMHYCIVHILYYTGIRLSELMALTTDDFDFINNRISITKSYVNLKLVKDPKNFKHRTIPVPQFVAEIIIDYLNYAEPEPGKRIFNIEHGAIDSMLKTASKNLGLVPALSAHQFRHTYISQLLRHNIPLATVSKLSGDTQETILKRYSHFFEDDDIVVVKVLENL